MSQYHFGKAYGPIVLRKYMGKLASGSESMCIDLSFLL